MVVNDPHQPSPAYPELVSLNGHCNADRFKQLRKIPPPTRFVPMTSCTSLPMIAISAISHSTMRGKGGYCCLDGKEIQNTTTQITSKYEGLTNRLSRERSGRWLAIRSADGVVHEGVVGKQ